MGPDVEQLLRPEEAGLWVLIDVAEEALGVSRRRALQLASSEGWHVAPGTRPRQYSFADIRKTYRNRQD